MRKSPLRLNFTKKSIALGFIFIGLSYWQYCQQREISLELYDDSGTVQTLFLPVKDRRQLHALMHNLFAEDNFAYTLLGNKPLSWVTYDNRLSYDSWESFLNSSSKYHRTLRSDWKTWEKYRHLFPKANFWAENPKSHPGSTSILLVNEEAFYGVIDKNKKDFQDVLCREEVDGVQLLNEAKDCSLMNDILKGHQALIGIVLGYGRDNSWQFLEGINRGNRLGCIWNLKNGHNKERLVYLMSAQ